MKRELALRLLDAIMQWDVVRASEEFAWLSLMSRLKYDGYSDFVAGVRFIESLADWLQQFDSQAEREAAYKFVRLHLVYVDSAQMSHLVELVYPETVRRHLVSAVASSLGIPSYRVWTQPGAAEKYRALLRRTLFLGLSDGARLDTFRRANVGVVSHEQIVTAYEINDEKWNSLLKELREETGDPSARFAFVYLVDDFFGSGMTLLRPGDGGKWEGKMANFWDQIRNVRTTHFTDDWVLCVHHYITTHKASVAVSQRQRAVLEARGSDWFQRVEFSFGMVLPGNLPLDRSRFSEFLKLVDKYYDPAIRTKPMTVGGTDGRLGFNDCALPLVLEHNTPNNSVALLWAETPGEDGHPAMRPLFRRRQRHS
jgi:hypothetical protein